VRHPTFRFRGRIIAAALVAACLMLAAIAALPVRSAAGSLNTSVIGMFPNTVGEFAYADLKAARKLTWWPRIREQLLPNRFRQFETFLTAAGIDPDTQVDELAWGGISTGKDSEDIVGVALGTFNPDATEQRFKQQKTLTADVRGYHIYTFGTGKGPQDIQFMFIDANTAAFGHRSALEQLIAVRFGDSESLLSNDAIFPLINEANGSGIIWAVLNKSYTHLAMQQLLPQVNQFPQAAQIVQRLRAMVVNIDADSGVTARMQAVCSTTDDANLLAAGLQAGLLYRRYQEASANPDLARVIDQVRVAPAGDRLKVEAPISEEQLNALIKSRAFVVPM
jgi:hypothetical protein